MIYREFAPSSALGHLVDRLWWLEGPAEAIGADPIPPDGRTEIIVHAGDPFVQRDGDLDWRLQGRILLAGQATRAVHVAPRGFTRVVGARLRPAAGFALFAQPQHELTDRIADLSDVDRPLARRLSETVAGLVDGEHMVGALDRALLAGMPARVEPDAAARAVDLAIARRGLVRVSQLARDLRISSRHLERLFQERVGLRPKQFLQIVRFQEALRAVRDAAATTRWADLAVGQGFYDQAHFIRDCHRFVGRPPSAFQVGDASLAAVFSAIRREQGRRAGGPGAFIQDLPRAST